jgi:hypothetical protein
MPAKAFNKRRNTKRMTIAGRGSADNHSESGNSKYSL